MPASATAPDPTALDEALTAATEDLLRAWSAFVLASARRHGENAAPLVLKAAMIFSENALTASSHMRQAMEATHARRLSTLRAHG